MTDNVQPLKLPSTVRTHIADLTTEDPQALVTYSVRDGQWKVQWSGTLSLDQVVGALDQAKASLLANIR